MDTKGQPVKATVMTAAAEAMYVPPQSIEAEQSVLGGLMLDNDALDKVADLLSPQDFYRSDHRIIYQAIVELIGDMHPADSLTVAEKLERSGKFQEVGGHAYLGSLAINTPSAANIRRYAQIVRERSVARQLLAASHEIGDSVLHPEGATVEDLVDRAQELIMAVDQQRAKSSQAFQTLDNLLPEVVQFVDAQHERYLKDKGNTVTGVPTGFADLDQMTAGLHAGELVILAARPSMGKSSLALNISEHAARATDQWALYFNLEMGNREQGLRTLGAAARITVQRLASGRIYEEEFPRVAESLAKMHGVKMAFNEQAGMTILDLRTLARRAMRELGPTCLIVVDYLQLMLAGETETNRANQLAEISRGLKLLAKEMRVPVLALAQLNRELEKRGNKRPMMSDLRDSGALEQDADLILFIYRDEVYNGDSRNKNVAEIIIAKQRNGPVGKIELQFTAEHTRFENLASRYM